MAMIPLPDRGQTPDWRMHKVKEVSVLQCLLRAFADAR